MHLPVGITLQGGKYEIVRYISSGGFGCTYKARHAMLNTTVAIKEFFVKDYCNRDASTYSISVATQGKAELIERLRKKFIEEAQAIFNMNHPNIVRVTDIFEENGTVYYVMDYIEGCSLASLIADKGRLGEKEALGYICQVADALGYVHSCNRLHLDVKPQNIMIDKNGKAVLIDFGVSKQYDEVKGENTSTLLGCTPGYAPIEQSGNGVVRFYPSADIYALGATLYKALTGVTPVAAHLRASGEELDPLPAEITPATCAAVEAAMKINKAHRPQSVAEFLKLLENRAKSKDERAESKAASFDNTSSDRSCAVQTPFAPHGSRPASVVKAESFDNIGSDSSSTPRGEVSRSDGGETELPKNKTASFDDDETRVGINPPRPSVTPPFEKVGELSKTDSDDEATRINSSSTLRGEVSRSDGGEIELPKVKGESFDNTSSDKSCAVQTPFAPHGSRSASVVKTENGKSKLPLIIIILLLSVILGVGGYLLFSGSGEENNDNISSTSSYTSNDDSNENMDFTVNGVSFKMVAVEGGTFQMGSNAGEEDEKPVHDVTLSDYYIGETEVTQELWQAVMGTTIRDQAKKGSWSTELRGIGDEYPMYYISYEDCLDFVSKLNEKLKKDGKLPAGREFRLPTEAEWEYAARGGKKSKGYEYSGSNDINAVAWYNEDWDTGSTHRVKQKTANELGLYDMSGNVWEWCFDSYASYTDKAQTNPKVDNGLGSFRVLRGGCWYNDARICRVALRNYYYPDNGDNDHGLRLAF